MHSVTDRQFLVNKGLMVAGKYVALQSEYRSTFKKTVKITLRDLPLHAVNNEEVLEALHDCCSVVSLVNYLIVWHNGQMMNIRNSDRFAYIEACDVMKVADHIDVGEY